MVFQELWGCKMNLLASLLLLVRFLPTVVIHPTRRKLEAVQFLSADSVG